MRSQRSVSMGSIRYLAGSALPAQFSREPRLGCPPIPQNGGLGYLQQRSGVRDVDAAEVPVFDDLRLARVQPRQLVERRVECQQLPPGRAGLMNGLVERH